MASNNWTWPELVAVLFIVVIAVVVASPYIFEFSLDLPAGMAPGDSGAQAIQSYLDNPEDNILTLIQYFVIPFMLVWLLTYAALEAGVARLFNRKISLALSLLFTSVVLFSPVFVSIAGALNAFGAIALFVFAIMGLVIGAEITWTEWQWERMSADDKIMKEKTELENEAKKINRKLTRLLQKSKSGGIASSAAISDYVKHVEDLRDESLGSTSLGTEANKVLSDISDARSNPKASVVTADEEIEDLTRRKEQLAREWKKVDKKVARSP